MSVSINVMAVGATCFGVSVGFITYRTLARTVGKTSISDLATVVGAIGGAAITSLFSPKTSDLFGWYSIGLLGGLAVFFCLYWAINGRTAIAHVMSGRTNPGSPPGEPGPAPGDAQHGPRR